MRPGGKVSPEDYRPGTREWLAACILEDADLTRAKRYGDPVPYYMLVPTHPAVAAMLAEYKRQKHIPASVSLSDMERTLWELSMLSDAWVDVLAEHYRARKHYGEEIRRAIRGEIDFNDLVAGTDA